ncbi:MAG: MFS transporter [Acidimicrobiales bacterium]
MQIGGPLPSPDGSDLERTPRPGTARSALAHRTFRIVFWGSFASNIGTWMQSVTLGAYALELTGSPTFLSLVLFAQLGPMLALSVVGGALADVVDRRRLLIFAQVEQLVGAAALAVLVAGGQPSHAALLAVVAVIGVGTALHAPTFSAVLPSLVGQDDLAGAVSLNSTQMNVARVTGPALGGVAFAAFGAAPVFAFNSLTYGFVIAALVVVRIPPVQADADADRVGWRRLIGGLAVARRDPIVRRCLVTMATFSFLCLPFIGQMPTLAQRNLGIEPRSVAYGLLYTCFGVGAIAGAVSIGTFLSAWSKPRLVRLGLVGFAASLAVLAVLRAPAPAYPVALVVGFFYFGSVTSLSVVLQERLADAVRGRVMALWVMAFGGTIPLGLLIAGPLAEHTSISLVMSYGVVAAVALAVYAGPRRIIAVSGTGPRRIIAVSGTGLTAAEVDPATGAPAMTAATVRTGRGVEPPAAPAPPPGCP